MKEQPLYDGSFQPGIGSYHSWSFSNHHFTVMASGGISFETAALASFGMLVVGFVVGLVVIMRFAVPKKSKS